MQYRVLLTIGRALAGLVLLGCVVSDRVAGPNGNSRGEIGPLITNAYTSAAGFASGHLLWQRVSTEEHSIWLLDAATFAPSYELIPQSVKSGYRIAGTGDFDRDGNVDIVWENLTTVPIERSVWFMNGDTWEGRSAMLQSELAPAGWSIVAVGDFNADGKPDLVWQNTATGEHGLWFMNGTKVDHFGNLAQAPLEWQIVGTGDFDGDGMTDLVWENLTTVPKPIRRIWLMSRGVWNGRYVTIPTDFVPDGWSIAAVGDVDGDGKPDLLWQKATTGERGLWLMNGTTVSRFVDLQTVSNTQWTIAGVLPRLGFWKTKAQMPSARSNATGGVLNGIFYVAGGINSSVPTGKRLEAFDPATNRWTIKAAMSFPHYEAVGGVINGVLYVAGGGQSSVVEAYNPAANTWTRKASMPAVRYGAGAAVVNGILYVFGGNVAPTWAYDPVANTWTVRASMPTSRFKSTVGVVNGIIYVAGGSDINLVYLATLEAYNPSTDSWTTKAPMPTARHEASGGVIDGLLYVAGGNGFGALKTMEAYNPAIDRWTTKAAAPIAPWASFGGVVNDVLYLAGGKTYFASVATMQAYSP